MNARQLCRWREFVSRTDLEDAAANAIVANAQAAIAENAAFRIVLAGGTTPRNIYRTLRTAAANWSLWHVYFGDERCLPVADPERNSAMADTEWLAHVAIPRDQIHLIPAELGAAEAAATYARELSGIGSFDLVLLGLGEDGHTASLFPGQSWEAAPTLPPAIPVLDAPKPPPQRVSLSPARLSAARQVIFVVNGVGKQSALRAWRAGVPIPASRIAPASGVDVFVNQSPES